MASPEPSKHVVAADYILPGVAVATVKALLTDAGRFSAACTCPWDRFSVSADGGANVAVARG